MTRVALPVPNRSGNACPRGAAEVVAAGRALADVRGAAEEVRCGADDVRGGVEVRVGVGCADVATARDAEPVTGGLVLDGDADAVAGSGTERAPRPPAAVCIGTNAGRAWPATALCRGAAEGDSSRAAELMPIATIAHPATPSDATPAANTRPKLMWSVCQV
jgi:hypothetical protein